MAFVKINERGLKEVEKQVIKDEAVPRMQRVADACNLDAKLDDGFMVSHEGSDKLTKRDFRATVITASVEAARHNAKSNTLIRNFHQAGGV